MTGVFVYLTQQHAANLGAPPEPQPSCAAQVPPDQLGPHELLRLNQAAYRAKTIYPGIVGETLADALAFEVSTKLRFSTTSKVARLVNHLMTAPVPRDAA